MADDNRKDGFVIWFTGLPGSGKTTLARLVEKELRDRRLRVEVLDGDEVREQLSKDLGFSKDDRDTHIRRIGFVCKLLSRNGVVGIVAAISPYRTLRDEVRMTCHGRFVEIYLKCPLDLLVRRDPKGLYRRALAGEIDHFSGISDPYEEPIDPELVLETNQQPPESCCIKILGRLKELQYIEG